MARLEESLRKDNLVEELKGLLKKKEPVMPMPLSYGALGYARGFMDKAIESKKGGRLLFKTKDQVWHFRARCYSGRTRELKNNAQIYPERA